MEDPDIKITSEGLINMAAPSKEAAKDEAGEIPQEPKNKQEVPETRETSFPSSIGPEEDEAYDETDLEGESEESYLEGFEDGLDTSSDLVTVNKDSIYSKRENTRSTLAIVYTIATFTVFLIAMFIAVLDGLVRKVSIIDNLAAVIPLISGVFFGTLGFVLGYYFRKGEE